MSKLEGPGGEERRAGGAGGLVKLVEEGVGRVEGLRLAGSRSSVGGTQLGVILRERFLGGPDGTLVLLGAMLSTD